VAGQSTCVCPLNARCTSSPCPSYATLLHPYPWRLSSYAFKFVAPSSNPLIPSDCAQSADAAIGSGEFLSPPYARVRCISLLYLLRISKVPRLVNRFRVHELFCFRLIAFIAFISFMPSSLHHPPPPPPSLAPLFPFPIVPTECVLNCRTPRSQSKSSWLFSACFGSFGCRQRCRLSHHDACC
jgi:hypothetical protein